MAWTTPGTAVAGNVLTAAFWNEQVRDNLESIRAAQVNVQSTLKSDTTTISLTANALSGNISGLEVTITPSSNTSKILVIANVSAAGESGFAASGLRLYRDSSAVPIGDSAGGRSRIATFMPQYDNPLGAGKYEVVYLDSPSTTSAITYGLRIINYSSITRSHYINRGYTDTDGNQTGRSVSTITAIEVPV